MLTENFKSNFSFNGSAPRSQYWGTIVITFLAVIIVTPFVESGSAMVLLISMVALISLLWVMLAVTAKRCRNCGLNPWWTAATLIPFIGSIVTIVLGCLSTKDSEG
jgi:uncharacterized membrane protein YhaH (DUF805 family)